MRIHLLCLLAPVALLASGCEGAECGDGTIERDGRCVPASETVGAARCGNGTMLVGDTCTPAREPTVCGPGTVREPDPQSGLVVCRPEGGGGGGCGAAITCPPPPAGKQTICGQLHDFETNERFEAPGALGERCAAGATTGPCALAIRAFDAIAFASNPGTAMPLAVEETYIDDCGRYRLAGITVPSGPFVGLGIDDAAPGMAGPLGVTNVVGLATPRAPDTATRGLEAFVAPKATTDAWAASGGPPLSTGIYAMVFRARRTGTALGAGVTATLAGNPVMAANDHYFAGCSSLRTSIDAAANATGGNGTALITGASVAQGVNYSGTGGLPPECAYSTHAGASLPNILFVQVVRPINATGMTCPL
jgi:hypothetical protein